MAKNTAKKSAPKKRAAKAKGKKASVRRKAPIKVNEPKMVEHVVTQDDLDTSPELLEKGVKVGDKILVPEKGRFHLKVEMNDEVTECDTDDIKEAILNLKPAFYKTKIIITASYEKRSAEFVLFPQKARRIFTQDLAAEFFAKNVTIALDAK